MNRFVATRPPRHPARRVLAPPPGSGAAELAADDRWPGWRGRTDRAWRSGAKLPLEWTATKNIAVEDGDPGSRALLAHRLGRPASSSPRRSRATSCPARRRVKHVSDGTGVPASRRDGRRPPAHLQGARARREGRPRRSGSAPSGKARRSTRVTRRRASPRPPRSPTASGSTPYFGSEGLYAYDFDGQARLEVRARRRGARWASGVGTSPAPLQGPRHPALRRGQRRRSPTSSASTAAPGKEVWRVPRKIEISWATPVIVHGATRDELVTGGNEADHRLRPRDRSRAVADEGPREQRGHHSRSWATEWWWSPRAIPTRSRWR